MSEASDRLLANAYQARRENRPADARRMFAEAVELCRPAGGPGLARALTGLGQIERDSGRLGDALRNYEAALAIYRAEGDTLKIAHTVRHAGDIHHEDGRPELAEPCYREALDLYRHNSQTPPLDLANAIRSLAVLEDEAGRLEQARTLWEEARSLYEAVQIGEGVSECARRIARLSEA